MAVSSKYYYMALKILSVNCQGLGSMEKRLDVLNYLKKKKAMSDILSSGYSHNQNV